MDPFGIIGKTITTGGASGYVTRADGTAVDVPANLWGRWTVEEYQPYEPSAYCHEAGYGLFREGCHPDNEHGAAFLPLTERDDVPALDERVKIEEEA